MRPAAFASLSLLILLAASVVRAEPGALYEVRPSEADPAIRDYDAPSLAIAPPTADAPLALFLPGTGGKPANIQLLLKTMAAQGYGVIGLEYPDEPSVVQVCPRDPNPACSADFREMRLYGRGAASAVRNSATESISGRLAALLVKLDRDHPADGWGSYLKDGQPDWTRMVVSGQSQGAGMAAYLAKQTPVARVVLFSSPWDFTNPGRKLAPWLSKPSATPPDRWYAAYNARETPPTF